MYSSIKKTLGFWPVLLPYALYVGVNVYLYREADSRLYEYRAEETALGLPHLSIDNITGTDRDLPPTELSRMISGLEELEDRRDFHKAKMFNPFANFKSIYEE